MSRQGEQQPRTLVNVKEFWNKEASEWGENPQVTIRDHYLRLLEIEAITELIAGRSNVLDMGCGTGFATLFYSQKVEQIIGADYADKMITAAQRFLDEPDYFERTMRQYAIDGVPARRDNVRFEQGDILSIGYADASFDALVSQRVLINLPQRELQDNAVQEVARVLQPGGLWVSVEVTEQGHKKVDAIRTSFGLPILEKYWHNLYLDEPHFEKTAAQANFDLIEVRRFETYQFLTKVVHPLVVKPEEPRFLAGFNDAARRISREYPTNKAVSEIGMNRFFETKFRPLLERYDPKMLPAYDRVIAAVIKAAPDFTGCTHQVMHVLKRSR